MKEKIYVLVIEDDVIQQEVIKYMLEKHNCVVDIANTARLGLVRLQQGDYNICFTDNNLGDKTGCELVKDFRDFEEAFQRKRIPIIGLTTMVNKSNENTFIEAGMDMVFKKPITEDIIIQILKAFT